MRIAITLNHTRISNTMAQIVNHTPFTGHVSGVSNASISLIQKRFARGFWGTLGDWLRNQNVRSFKIGITNDPNDRANKYGNNYQFMDVIYQTSSYEYSQDMERILINAFRDHPGNENIRGGGAGRKPKSGPFFVYVVYNIGQNR